MRIRRLLSLLLVILLPLQGLAGELMLACQHDLPAISLSPATQAVDGHGVQHGNDHPDNAHAQHTLGASELASDHHGNDLNCDSCAQCDVCASPALIGAAGLPHHASPAASPERRAQHFSSIILDEPPRPPARADRV